MKHRRNRIVWLVCFLVFVAALAGPWPIYDRINVPAQYACSAPFVRLEGDYCGTPFSGIYLIWTMGMQLVSIFITLFSGTNMIMRLISTILTMMVFVIVLSPVAATFLIATGKSTRKIHIIRHYSSAVAGVICIVFAIANSHQFNPSVWGIWLFILAALASFLVEIVFRKTLNNNLDNHPLSVE